MLKGKITPAPTAYNTCSKMNLFDGEIRTVMLKWKIALALTLHQILPQVQSEFLLMKLQQQTQLSSYPNNGKR